VSQLSSNFLSEQLVKWHTGDRNALLPLVYDELRRLARRCLREAENRT
jgi:hypothetical protein